MIMTWRTYCSYYARNCKMLSGKFFMKFTKHPNSPSSHQGDCRMRILTYRRSATKEIIRKVKMEQTMI